MDIYKEITDRIIREMETGIIPWQKPWVSRGGAISHSTGKPYSLLNQLLLGREGEYITFKQCQEEGGKIRKGEKAKFVVFWKFLPVIDEETQEEKQVPFLRYYSVFHIDQCEGIEAKHMESLPELAETDTTAESIIADYLNREGVHMIHQTGNDSYYQPSTDKIVLPLIEQFKGTAQYYSTAFHELIHSTGHPKRLNRIDATAFFGTESYSKEELVAEIGAATLTNLSGLESAASMKNSSAYIQNWLQVLKNDKHFIISAAGKAEKAVNLVLGA